MKFTVREFPGDRDSKASVYVMACREIFKVGSAKDPKDRCKTLRFRDLPLELVYSVEMEAWRAREVEMFALRWLHETSAVRDIVKPTKQIIADIPYWHNLRRYIPSPKRKRVTEWFDGDAYAGTMVVKASEMLLRRYQ